jgi:spermidine/putrescine transport system substrate-binding protein
MSPEYVNNPAVFPSDEVIARSEPPRYRGEDVIQLLDAAWTRIQAA